MKHAILMLALLAACSPAPDATQAPVAEASVVAPPDSAAPEVVSLRILQSQNGQTIETPLNRPFSVELQGEPAQGFSWRPVETPAFIAPAAEGTAALPASDTVRDAPPVIGLGSDQTFFFIATTVGSGDLVLEHRRFGGGPPARETFRVTIVAR